MLTVELLIMKMKLNKPMKKSIILILILFTSFQIFAQKESKKQIIELTGRIIDISTNKPIQFAHIINLKKGQGAITDTAGKFRILMTKIDTLRISSIGYEIKYWGLADTSLQIKQFNTVMYLIPKTYKISEVDIYQLRWESFLYDIAHTKIEKDKTQKKLIIWFDKIISENDLKSLTTSARGIGFTIPFKTKREKQLLKVEKLKKQAEINKIAYQKFNRELVNEITGLENKELDNFMIYGNFSTNYIINTNKYDLIVRIQEIFQNYQKNNNNNNNN